MEFDRIKQLLAKYWECETTLEEEKELKKYFNSNQVDERLQHAAPLFQYLDHEKKHGQLDDMFDEELLRQLEEQDEVKESVTPKRGKLIPLFQQIAQVAAVILIVATAGYFMREEYFNKKDQVDPYIADTFEDPQEAFEETKKALMLISKNFNKGRKEAQRVGIFNEAQERIKETEDYKDI